MSTLSDLSTQVFQRLEEPTPTFWNNQLEILPFLVEALNEACLITGEPQVRQSTVFTLAAATTFFNVPSNCVAMLRMEGPGSVFKTSVYDLDRLLPGWQGATGYGLGPYGMGPYGGTVRGDVPQYWFPLGLQSFGIYPALRAPVNVILTYVALPIATPILSLTGNEVITSTQEEYREALVDLAVVISAFKEGGQELIDALPVLNRYLSRMVELSRFGLRKGSLRFSVSLGAPARVSPVEQR